MMGDFHRCSFRIELNNSAPVSWTNFISCLLFKKYLEWCAGLSLKSQELTAIFLAVRLYCSFVMEYDIHTLLDLATLGTTLWVIYMIRFKLKSSYMEDKDNFAIYYVVCTFILFSCNILFLDLWKSTLLPVTISQDFQSYKSVGTKEGGRE